MTTLEHSIAQLIERGAELPLLPKNTWMEALSEDILAMDSRELASEDAPEWAADAMKSALLLWNDDLHASHDISQQLEESTGSLLHGMMHRREGDFSNASYWYQGVGDHPIFPALLEKSKAVYPEIFAEQTTWNAPQFIQLVNQATSEKDAVLIATCQRVQQIEMHLIVDYIASLSVS
ncbi:hypothetical protein [Aureibacillus halotolerans]|uniref:Uncharacterized protein n=1 Tax=Aureibacillus halotolerans TaxID=1508390 RepID=A0A4R6U6X1_9BACI|nr:hypothetical protein [Aureibacillus halotolerans]TDQ42051.1 hypothetical protein EV213_10279 [Aureibacillus halotolerans]